jgi:hypothetical protein
MKPTALTLALFAATCMTGAITASDPKPPEPTLVVQLKSVDGLLKDVKYLAKLVNQSDQADQLEGLISAVAGPNGLAGSGLDVNRPFLAYAIAKPTPGENAAFAVMVPIAEETTFLKLLDTLNIKSEQDEEGVRTLELPNPPVSLHFKFANKYAYVTAQSKGNLRPKTIVPPERLAVADPNLILGMRVQLDQIPDELKNLALGQIELRLAGIKDQKKPDETPDQERMRRMGIDAISQAIKYVLSEGKTAELTLAINPIQDDITASLALAGKPNTMLGTLIGLMGGGKTRFAPAADAALHIGLNLAMPQMFRPLAGGLIDTGFKDLMARESDPAKKEVARKLFDAVGPTLKAGTIDLHLVGSGPNADGQFNVLAAVGVQNGMGIETAVKELVGKMPATERGPRPRSA